MKKMLVALVLLAVASASWGQDTAPAAQAAPPPTSAAPARRRLRSRRPSASSVYPGSGQDAAKQARTRTSATSGPAGRPGLTHRPRPRPRRLTRRRAARSRARPVGRQGEPPSVRFPTNAISETRVVSMPEKARRRRRGGGGKGRRAQKKAGKQAEAQAKQAAQARTPGAKDTFKKAWGACLEGRGYSVK